MESAPPDIVWTDAADPSVSETILRALPDWFGIEHALVGYVKSAAAMPTATAWLDGTAIGFASLERTTDSTCDLHVIGLLPEYHGRGVGKMLVSALERRARGDGARFLTVKTSSSHYCDPFYTGTRHFYEAVGFAPLAELPEHWGPDNPCLLMGKYLG